MQPTSVRQENGARGGNGRAKPLWMDMMEVVRGVPDELHSLLQSPALPEWPANARGFRQFAGSLAGVSGCRAWSAWLGGVGSRGGRFYT
jgi:hypothetical protein